jgi:hypothetical protein
MINNSDDLFIPIDSKSVKDRDIVAKILPINYDEYYLHQDYDLGIYGDVIFLTNDYGNIGRLVVRKELKRIYNLIQKINITHNNQTYFYKDLCAKRNNECVIEGDIFFRETFWQRLYGKQFDKYILNDFYTDDDGVPNMLTFIFGKNLKINLKEGKLSAKVLKLRFNLRRILLINNQNQNIEILSRMWEQAFLKFFQHFQSVIIRPIYAISTSIDQELENNINLGKKNNLNNNTQIQVNCIYRYDVSSYNIYYYDYCRYYLSINTWSIITITCIFISDWCYGYNVRINLWLWILFTYWYTYMFISFCYTIFNHW